MIYLVALLLLIAGALLASIYTRRAPRSVARSQIFWKAFKTDVERVIRDDSYPQPVAEFVYELAMTAGCGCYVRQMLVTHYLPSLWSRLSEEASEKPREREFDAAMQALSKPKREQIKRIMVTAIVFDSFYNPFQGWLFRRVLNGYKNPQPSTYRKVDMQEASHVTYKVVRNRAPRHRHTNEPCAA